VVEYVHSNCFIKRFRAAVSVLVGPCCPALLNCIVRTVVLLGNKNDDEFTPKQHLDQFSCFEGLMVVTNTDHTCSTGHILCFAW